MEPIAPPFAVEDLLAQASWTRSLARRLIQDVAEAEDLAQDTLAAALTHRPATNRALRPWLATVMRRRIAWLARRRGGQTAREADVARDEALPSSADLAARAETQRRLVGEVVALEDPYRSLLLLRFYEGLAPAEIARRCGRSPATVRAQLSRAVALLRERLDAKNDEAQLDWRLALLPLVGEPPAGSIMTSLPLATLIIMHALPKLILAAVLLVVAFLVYDRRSGEPPAFVARNEQVTARIENIEIEAPLPEAAVRSVTNQSGPPDERGERRPVQTAVLGKAADVPVRSIVEGLLTIREPDGSVRPVEGFLLELLQGATPSEAVRTDGAGRFHSENTYAAGSLRIAAPDHADLERDVYFGLMLLGTGDDEATVVSFQPNIPIHTTLQARREFNLQFSGPPDVVVEIDRVELVSVPTSEEMNSYALAIRRLAPLRRGRASDANRAWARFAPLNMSSNPSEWWLRVESPDGLWAAEARVPEAEGFDPTPSHLHLIPTARLEVDVPWPTADEPKGISVSIQSAIRPTNTLEMALTPAEGQQSIHARGGLVSGPYLLSAFADGTAVVLQEVQVLAGEVERVVLELDFASALFPLVLRLSSDSGDFHGMLAFSASSRELDRVLQPKSGVSWERNAAEKWIGTQDLGLVQRGEYAIDLVHSRPLRAWDLSNRTAVVPGPPLEIEGLDWGGKSDLRLQIVDARTGAKIKTARSTIHLNGERSSAFDTWSGTARWKDIVLSPTPRWTVEAKGYGAASGDWSQFEWVDGERYVEVALEPEV